MLIKTQGMADEVGCKLLDDCERLRLQHQSGNEMAVVPKAYKCLTWGSLQECMQYLVRRVVENRGGMERMRDGLSAYQAELKRRLLGL
jgi:proline dehydrogenase